MWGLEQFSNDNVESHYEIAIARLSDWLKRLAPVFQPMKSKPKPIAPCTRDVSLASSELEVIARNCDWFIALPTPVVIGRSNYFGFGFVFRQSFENRSITGGFHLMSPPPSWGTEQKRKNSFGNFTQFLCKT